jgi:predicted amidohydrolase YtcJ
MFSSRSKLRCSGRQTTGADLNASEAITVPQALVLYTGRARQICALSGVGLIQPGYEASFVVLDREIFTIPAADIDQIHVTQTSLRGEKAWQRTPESKVAAP